MELVAKIKRWRLRILKCFFRLLPVKKNKVLFWSFGFNAYSCNPKYIAKALKERYAHEVDICWVFDVSVKVPQDFPYRYVRYFSLEYMKEIATARVLVCNSRIDEERYYFKKRKKQFYIQTWHGSFGPKHIEKDAEEQLGPDYVAMAKRDSEICNLMMADCEAFAELCRKSCWYDGEVMINGLPRCDLFFTDAKEQIREELGIPGDLHLAVYAPTFRKSKVDLESLDYERLCGALKERFGGEWMILRSVHPNLRHTQILEPPGCRLMAETDVQELIHISDCLISDYSSTMLDAAMAGKNVFLFTPDLQEYRNDDRGFYYDISETPFPLCQTNEELGQAIRCFDREQYEQGVADLFARFGIKQDGRASERMAERIVGICRVS